MHLSRQLAPHPLLRRLFLLLSAGWIALAAPVAPAQTPGYLGPPTTVIEFYNTCLGHYFMTLVPEEITDIDAGARAGPSRLSFFTGRQSRAPHTPGA